jgi:3-deoxy-7-phosphoheptulonate synthase
MSERATLTLPTDAELLRCGAVPLPSPLELEQMHPLEPGAADIIRDVRGEVIDIMDGRDHRMLVVVGPCSLDDSRQPNGEYSAVTFAKQLQELQAQPGIAENLLLVMRCPPPKPRTDLGQRGLEQRSIETSHKILTAIANLGVPLASEVMLARHMAEYGPLMSLVWTGARNGEDTNLRHTLSAYPEIPVWCKNAGSGDFGMATGAVTTIAASHDGVEIMLPNGQLATLQQPSPGNPHVGILYRGGKDATTPDLYESRLESLAALAAELGAPLAADTSHGGSVAHDEANGKTVEGQRVAHEHIMQRIEAGRLALQALWIEGYLHAGADKTGETPGRSLTDECVCMKGIRQMLKRTAEVHAKLRRDKEVSLR